MFNAFFLNCYYTRKSRFCSQKSLNSFVTVSFLAHFDLLFLKPFLACFFKFHTLYFMQSKWNWRERKSKTLNFCFLKKVIKNLLHNYCFWSLFVSSERQLKWENTVKALCTWFNRTVYYLNDFISLEEFTVYILCIPINKFNFPKKKHCFNVFYAHYASHTHTLTLINK